MKYFVQNRWWTSLGARIAVNDVLNSMENCHTEIASLKPTSTMEDMVKIAHKHGMVINVKLVPKQRKNKLDKVKL